MIFLRPISLLLFCIFLSTVSAQVICINCYRQNEPISPNAPNLILNGSFESTNCNSGDNICPASPTYSCDFSNWNCTGGGTSTYAQLPGWAVTIPDGTNVVYLGNWFSTNCSATADDTSCVINSGCTVEGIPPGYPHSEAQYGGSTGVSLDQTVSGLIPGEIYFLEFWGGGEGGTTGFSDPGLFGIDIGFGYLFLSNVSTCYSGAIGTRYIIEFRATSSSHTIKFTNWGHKCSSCTELILDDVRLYDFADLSPNVEYCPFENCDLLLEMPNVFSPNNDEPNNRFMPINVNTFNKGDLSIFNRWGNKVYESSDLREGWDGNYNNKICPEGTYYWIIDYTNDCDETKTETGFLTLFR